MPMPQNHLQVIEGGKDADDLIVTMLQALRLASASGSEMTYNLLRMALLNEGVQLAKTLATR
jgi:hypothetical protein